MSWRSLVTLGIEVSQSRYITFGFYLMDHSNVPIKQARVLFRQECGRSLPG